MSLSAIFDPLVRAWFEENLASGGTEGGAVAIRERSMDDLVIVGYGATNND